MVIGNLDVQNPLDVIKCIMAFDSRDWFKDKRDRMLWAVVFGITPDCEQDYRNKGYTDEQIAEYRKLHDRYEELLANNYPAKKCAFE